MNHSLLINAHTHQCHNRLSHNIDKTDWHLSNKSYCDVVPIISMNHSYLINDDATAMWN